MYRHRAQVTSVHVAALIDNLKNTYPIHPKAKLCIYARLCIQVQELIFWEQATDEHLRLELVVVNVAQMISKT